MLFEIKAIWNCSEWLLNYCADYKYVAKNAYWNRTVGLRL